MKTLIKSSLIATAFFASSVMAAGSYDSDIMSHSKEGIMGGFTAALTQPVKFDDFSADLTAHPTAGYYIAAPVETGLAKTHCVNIEAFVALEEHPIEGGMGLVQQRC